MPNKTPIKKLPGVPSFLLEPPSDELKKVIKDKLPEFVQQVYDEDADFGSSTDLVAGFIAGLAEEHETFKRIKPQFRKCTYSFVEKVRLMLKYEINKFKKNLDGAKQKDSVQKSEHAESNAEQDDVS